LTYAKNGTKRVPKKIPIENLKSYKLSFCILKLKVQTTGIVYDIATRESWSETTPGPVSVNQVKLETENEKGDVFSVEKYPIDSAPAEVGHQPPSYEQSASSNPELLFQKIEPVSTNPFEEPQGAVALIQTNQSVC
jgi:hypothetical protein